MAKSNDTISLSSLWEDRMLGVELPPIDINRPITPEEVQYLLQLYPFLQILNSEPNWGPDINVKLVTTQSGWVIHDYDQALSVSPGELLFGYKKAPPSDAKEEEEGGSGHGTLVKQTYETAEFMVQYAIDQGWPGIEIIAGTPFMQWAAWMAAEDRNLIVFGYEASKTDKVKRDRIIRLRGEFERSRQPDIKPRG